MIIDIDIEEEIDFMMDTGKRDLILILRQATDNIPAFVINVHMDIEVFNLLKKKMDEYARGE